MFVKNWVIILEMNNNKLGDNRYDYSLLQCKNSSLSIKKNNDKNAHFAIN